MKKLALLSIFLALPLLAQTPPPVQPPVVIPATTTFSLNASVLQIGNIASGSTAAADFGGTLQITDRASFRQENILAPSASWQGYFGGVNYALPNGFLKKTKLSVNQFSPYLTASMGVGINSQNGTTKQNLGELIGGGINYSPGNNGKFTANLIELRYAHLPGFNSSTVVASVGVKLGW